MKNRIIEVASDGRYLHADRGFLVIKRGMNEQARVPIDDVGALIGSGHGLVMTGELVVRLAERRAPLVVCNRKKQPAAMLLPLQGHHLQGERLWQQAHAKPGLRNRLWKQIVQSKLRAQARTLEAFGRPGARMRRLVQQVRAGDPANIEAQGARIYWTLLFGTAFRRDPDQSGINQLLNYGYVVLRTAAARSIVAAGLHPTLGLHHRNPFNSMALADDLMEPLRPLIDAAVFGLIACDRAAALSPDNKRLLALVLYRMIPTEAGLSPITTALDRMCFSLTEALSGSRRSLELPGELSATALRALATEPITEHGEVE